MAVALNQLNLGYLDDRFGSGRPAHPDPVLATLQRIWILCQSPTGARSGAEPL